MVDILKIAELKRIDTILLRDKEYQIACQNRNLIAMDSMY